MDLNGIINDAPIRADPNDYKLDGIIYCGLCHTPKQCYVQSLGLMPSLCECQAEQHRIKQAETEQRRIEQEIRYLRETGISDHLYRTWTFDKDDRRNPKATDTAKSYVSNWAVNRAQNNGILFSGQIGTGKTFHAACIANALIDLGVCVKLRNISRLIARATNFDDDIYPEIERAELLILDDIGTGRSTEFATETLYNIIDARYRTNKPLIVTTNLTQSELANEPDYAKQRAYDRIIERCQTRILYNGTSRRIEKAKQGGTK